MTRMLFGWWLVSNKKSGYIPFLSFDCYNTVDATFFMSESIRPQEVDTTLPLKERKSQDFGQIKDELFCLRLR